MTIYSYKVVPAPVRGQKAKGVKTNAARFALAVEDILNEMAAEGWEYVRTDILPAEERQGLTGKATVFQNLMVFRRLADAVNDTDGHEEIRLIEERVDETPEPRDATYDSEAPDQTADPDPSEDKPRVD